MKYYNLSYFSENSNSLQAMNKVMLLVMSY